jgi:hypothetical protein
MANGSKRKAALKVRQKNMYGNNIQIMFPRYTGVKKEKKDHFI